MVWLPETPEDYEAATREYVGHARVPKEPHAKERPRTGKGGNVYTPKPTQDAEATISDFVKAKMKLRGADEVNAFVLCVHFFCGPIDKRRKEKDVDNLLKTVLDGMNGVLYADDRAVAEITTRLHRNSSDPHTDIWAWRLRPAEWE